MSSGSVSAFLLCYNDQATIASLIETLDRSLQNLGVESEIIVVNDGSTDGSAQVLSEVQKTIPYLRVVTHRENQGYGAAVQTGFSSAEKELVFYTDGDGQYDPRSIEELYRAWSPTVDVVQGYKKDRHDPWFRIVLGEVYRRTVRFLFRLKTRDINCDCRLIRRALWLALSPSERGGAIGLEMVTKLERARAVFVEVPVPHFARTSGRSQFFSMRNIALLVRSVARIWWRTLRATPIVACESAPHSRCKSRQKICGETPNAGKRF